MERWAGMSDGRRPLILGSGGRVGRMFRRLAAQGLWPGAEPLWHTRDGRDGTLAWDMAGGGLPDWHELPEVGGIVVLAGATSAEAAGDEGLRSGNVGPALAAFALARDRGIERVLLCSSAAVYGPGGDRHGEDGALTPSSSYGRAKAAMETEAARDLERHGGPTSSALRIGNVAGADALFGAAARGPVVLDRLADGSAPRRIFTGPLTLARAMVALLDCDDLPGVINLAQPGLVGMDAILLAAGVPWDWHEAPPSALPSLEMDLSRLLALVPLPPATPDALVAEARLAGWRPWGEVR